MAAIALVVSRQSKRTAILFSYQNIAFNYDSILNRSREEILADMLSVAIEPVNKTAIMYKAKLSYEQLKDYLSYMVDRQMIESMGGTWVTTERGKTYLASYQLIVRIIA